MTRRPCAGKSVYPSIGSRGWRDAMRAALLSLSKRFGQADFFATRLHWSALLLVLPQLVALGIMLATENNNISIAAYLVGWGLLNFLLLALLRRPAVAGLAALILVTLLVLLSQLKYDVMWMTANFVDVMIVDTDTIAFLFTIFP